MKTRRFTLIGSALFVLLSLGGLGCSNSSDTTCNMETSQSEGVGEVTYTATKTGDAEVDTIAWATDEGPMKEDAPTLPWTKVVTLTTVKARISVNGDYKTGTIAVGYAMGPPEVEEIQVACAPH